MEFNNESLNLVLDKVRSAKNKAGTFIKEKTESKKNKLIIGVAGGLIVVTLIGVKIPLPKKAEETSTKPESSSVTEIPEEDIVVEEITNEPNLAEKEIAIEEKIVEESELNIILVDRDIPEEYKPAAGTYIGLHADTYGDMIKSQDATIVLAKRENGVNNVYIIAEPEIEGTTIHDFMLDEDVELSDTIAVELHPISTLLVDGELQDSFYYGMHVSVEVVKLSKDTPQEIWGINFEWRLPYNWANYYLSKQGLEETVEMPNVPEIRKAKFEQKQNEKHSKQFIIKKTI